MRARERRRRAVTGPRSRSEIRTGRGVRWTPLRLLVGALCIALGLSVTTGCSVTTDDLARWETTLEGPKRLRAVVLHDKYPHPLRVRAAMSLIRMKPRKGQRVGIKLLVEKTLAELSPEERGKIVAELIPLIVEELARKSPVAQPGQPLPPDPSFKYKDAAYMMLTYDRTPEGTTIITDPELKKQLHGTLTAWAMADFERRLNDRAQMYGMEQLLRYIGAPSVVGLPPQMTKNAKSLAKMADIVAKLGDRKTKEEAGKKLVAVAAYIASAQWRDDKKPELEEANRRAQIEPTQKQFDKQLQRYQDESLLRVLGSMKKLGGDAVMDYCLKVGADKEQAPKRRQAALAALEGRLLRDQDGQIDRVLAIAASDAPDVVLDQAFRRIRELPRDKVVSKLYDLFKTDKWKIRRAAGATVLQMSKVKDIEEFLTQLGQKARKNFSLGESLTYGAYLGELKDGNPREIIDKYLSRGAVQSRLTAIGYFYTFGLKADIPTLQRFDGDKTKIPECEEDAECAWECDIPKPDDPKARETKEIAKVGDFVRFCIIPQMEKNKPRGDKEETKKDEGKQKEKGEAKSP